jgi:hypothetical protein
MLVFLIGLSLGNSTQSATCYLTVDQPNISLGVADPSGVAWATYSETINSTGFNRIVIESNPAFSSASQLLCGGYVDGYLTQHRIWERFLLYKDIENISRSADFPQIWRDWLDSNMAFMRRQVSSNPSDHKSSKASAISTISNLSGMLPMNSARPTAWSAPDSCALPPTSATFTSRTIPGAISAK